MVMVKEQKSSLEQILEAKERRCEKQNELIQKCDSSVITFTMNIPGPVKNTTWIQKAFELALVDLNSFLTDKIVLLEKRITDAGPEAFFTTTTKISPIELKRLTIIFETQHSIGRWFDIDIRDKYGNYISREQLAMTSRKCFLCGKDAKFCARNKTHSVDDLFLFTQKNLLSYLENVNDK